MIKIQEMILSFARSGDKQDVQVKKCKQTDQTFVGNLTKFKIASALSIVQFIRQFHQEY